MARVWPVYLLVLIRKLAVSATGGLAQLLDRRIHGRIRLLSLRLFCLGVQWAPPSAEAGGSITLRGRKFGFQLEEIRQWLLIYEKEGTEAQMRTWIKMADGQLEELAEQRRQMDEAMAELNVCVTNVDRPDALNPALGNRDHDITFKLMVPLAATREQVSDLYSSSI